MPQQRNRLTPESIAAMRAAHARIAPFLPPNIAQAIWIARLSGHYDPAAGKHAIPALGLYPPEEQPGFPGGRMPGALAPSGRFGAADVFPQTTLPPKRMAARDPIPDMSGLVESPFVRAATNSQVSSSEQQRPTAQAPRLVPAAYADDGRSGGLYGGTVTPIARVPTDGQRTTDHDPDEWQDPSLPMDTRTNSHPKWSDYTRAELGDPVGAIGQWSTKEDDWEYSTDGGRNWSPVPVQGKSLPLPGIPNANDNPRGHIFRRVFRGV